MPIRVESSRCGHSTSEAAEALRTSGGRDSRSGPIRRLAVCRLRCGESSGCCRCSSIPSLRFQAGLGVPALQRPCLERFNKPGHSGEIFPVLPVTQGRADPPRAHHGCHRSWRMQDLTDEASPDQPTRQRQETLVRPGVDRFLEARTPGSPWSSEARGFMRHLQENRFVVSRDPRREGALPTPITAGCPDGRHQRGSRLKRGRRRG